MNKLGILNSVVIKKLIKITCKFSPTSFSYSLTGSKATVFENEPAEPVAIKIIMLIRPEAAKIPPRDDLKAEDASSSGSTPIEIEVYDININKDEYTKSIPRRKNIKYFSL